jgi:hypothetical protein
MTQGISLIISLYLASIGLLLTTCYQIRPPTPTPLPTLEALPEFILEAWPKAAGRVSQEFYQSDLSGEMLYEGSRSVEEFGYNSNICVYLDVAPVIQKDDQIMSYEDVIQRVKFYLNGQKLSPKKDDRWAHVEIEIFYPELSPNTRSGAPFWLCWPAELAIGMHQARLEFRQTDGTIQSYDWFFEITAP